MSFVSDLKGMSHPNLDEMKQLINEKASLILDELTKANLDYFVKEAVSIAKVIMEKYVFSIRKMFSNGEFAIKDIVEKARFTDFKTGYQQTMLEWIEQNKPNIEFKTEIPVSPQETSEKKWHYATLGVGTAGAIALAIGRCWLSALAVEIATLAVSYFIYKKEKDNSDSFSEKLNQYELDLKTNKEAFVNETISQLEEWIKKGESYSNEILTTFNL